ncbi:FUSC family protein [Xylophilus sp. GOD-11R]|uniref:FUSC family protein n=1 Tax=Xylophilus sp. GOD-11R TaxID=3089814 RepID=UPI00298CDF2B|nr:FUSC family protein [Xylophilus sp. GOD-11R]WPB57242.1 FUSC family protein [Xylophilus sp. GOD-11R]
MTTPAPAIAAFFTAFDRPRLGQAARMALAAILAFSVAALLDVRNAYWAAMPVWVVAQASRGLLIERGVYRLLGTLAGAGFGLGLLAVTREPVLLLAALGLWVAAMAGLTHLLVGVKSYGAMLAGMTTAVVVLPCLHAGQALLLPLAIARIECTLIGVLAVTLVTGWFTPAARRHDFYLRVRRMAADATACAANAVAGRCTAEDLDLERRTLFEIADTEALARTMAAGSLEGYRRLRHTTALAAASLALMAAAVALRARLLRGNAVDGALSARLQAQSEALRDGPADRWGGHDADWSTNSAEGPEARLRDAMRHIVQAENALFDDRPAAVSQPQLAEPRDWQRARARGALAGLATFVAALVGLLSGGPAGELMALGVCIFSMVLGSLPTPRVVAPKLLVGVLAGVVAATLYRFVIQPHVGGPIGLIASVVPFIVIGALARVHPRTAMPALDANMCFMLGSQAGGLPAHSASEILSGSAALALAAALVAAGLLLVPERGGARLQALASALRRDIGRRQTGASRRALQLLAELQRSGRDGATASGLLAALGFGASLAWLREGRRLPDADWRMLEGFAADPARAADEALKLARQVGDAAVALALCDAADALRAGAAWLSSDAAPPSA